jgi:hypothetical protein
VARVDDDIKNVRVLLNVSDAAAESGMVHHLLQWTAADGTVSREAERTRGG